MKFRIPSPHYPPGIPRKQPSLPHNRPSFPGPLAMSRKLSDKDFHLTFQPF